MQALITQPRSCPNTAVQQITANSRNLITQWLCSKCFDVMDQVHIECTEHKSSCNYTLSLEPPQVHPTQNTTAGYTTDPGLSYKVQRWRVLSTRKYFMDKPANSHSNSTLDIVSASPLIGCRCQTFYCVRSYTATIDHGVLHETLQSTSENWSSVTTETQVVGTVRVDCLAPQVQRYLLDKGCVSASND
jgi:hypothetical protein